jgi:hypothetical protein
MSKAGAVSYGQVIEYIQGTELPAVTVIDSLHFNRLELY